MEYILQMAKRAAEEAEVFMFSSGETPVHFEANRLKHIQSKESTIVALRIIKNGKIGYATTTNIENRQNIVDDAIETSHFGVKAQFEFPGKTSYPQVEVFDPDAVSIPVEEMIKLGEDLITQIKAHTPDVICEAEVNKTTIKLRIINSLGTQVNYSKSIFSLGIEGSLIHDTDMLFVGDSESSCHPLLDSERVSREVIQQLELAKENAPISSKQVPVIFTPNGVASALTMPLIVAFNGKTVFEGASPIGKRLGKQVFDRKLSLWDDPTIDYRPASRPCDDEGMSSQRTSLIERGTVAHFFYDLQSAALTRNKSTGNGSRNRSELPAPSPSAFIIAPGTTTFNDMIHDIKEGLVIDHLMGAGQGNILGGDFSGNVLLGYKVENGEVIGRVKDTMVSGNIYQILKDIIAVGSTTRWVGGFLQTPHLYCSNLSVASKR